MAAPVDNTATLKSLVSIANSKIEPKILTDRNYKVQSIKPLRSTTSPHNTVASVLIDLAADSPIAIVSSDRYSRRLVEFTRIDLKDIAAFRAIPKNEKGQLIGTITDVASAITLLDANIGADELVLIKTADATVVKAVEDSLGYVGAITFAGSDAESEEPTTEDPRPDLTVTTLGNSLFLTGENFTPHAIGDITYSGVNNTQAGTLDITIAGIWDQNVAGTTIMIPVALGDESVATQIDALKLSNPTQLALKLDGQALPVTFFGAEELILSPDGRYMLMVPLTTVEQTMTLELSLDGFVTTTQTIVRTIPTFEVIEKETDALKTATIRPLSPINGEVDTEFVLVSDFGDTSKLVHSHAWTIQPTEHFTEVSKVVTANTMEVTYRVAVAFDAETEVTVTNVFNDFYQATLTFTALAATPAE